MSEEPFKVSELLFSIVLAALFSILSFLGAVAIQFLPFNDGAKAKLGVWAFIGFFLIISFILIICIFVYAYIGLRGNKQILNHMRAHWKTFVVILFIIIAIVVISYIMFLGLINLPSINQIVNFLSQPNVNSSLMLLFTGLVAIATIAYAILTNSLVSETQQMKEIQHLPQITISVQTRAEWINFIDMQIKNTGFGPAYNISFNVLEDFVYDKNQKLSDLSLIKNGLKYLGPNQKIQFFLTSFAEDTELKKKPFKIKVNYKDFLGRIKDETFEIDLNELMGLRQLGEPPLYKISKSMETLTTAVNHLSMDFHKLKVIRYTKAEIDKQNKAFLKRARNQKKKK